MRYGAVFLVLAGSLALVAIVSGGWSWVLFWPAISCVGLAAAYGRQTPRLLGKRRDGLVSLWAVAVFAPYLAVTWILWQVLRIGGREPPCQEIDSGLWLGRRCLAGEVPDGLTHVVDLTAEFVEPRWARNHQGYLCIPTLDAMSTRPEVLAECCNRLQSAGGASLIHCASGHGRSAALVAVLLIDRGRAADVAEAHDRLRAIRPGVRLNRQQAEAVAKAVRLLKAVADRPLAE